MIPEFILNSAALELRGPLFWRLAVLLPARDGCAAVLTSPLLAVSSMTAPASSPSPLATLRCCCPSSAAPRSTTAYTE
jgi:hypothetical protein